MKWGVSAFQLILKGQAIEREEAFRRWNEQSHKFPEVAEGGWSAR